MTKDSRIRKVDPWAPVDGPFQTAGKTEKNTQWEGHFYVCGSARQVPEDIYTAMKEAQFSVGWGSHLSSSPCPMCWTNNIETFLGGSKSWWTL